MIFSVFQKNSVWGILGPPSYGIGATIRIGQEMLCLPYAGFFLDALASLGMLIGHDSQIEKFTVKDHLFHIFLPPSVLQSNIISD